MFISKNNKTEKKYHDDKDKRPLGGERFKAHKKNQRRDCSPLCVCLEW